MTVVHFHLMLNHFPLVGLFFSLVILLIGVWRSNENFVRAGYVILILSGLFAIPTFLTGEPSEEVMEKLPNFAKNLAHDHEEAAEYAIWMVVISALAGGVGLWTSLQKKATPKTLLGIIGLLSLLALLAIAQTSNLGGKISHPEVRDATDPTTAPLDTHD